MKYAHMLISKGNVALGFPGEEKGYSISCKTADSVKYMLN